MNCLHLLHAAGKRLREMSLRLWLLEPSVLFHDAILDRSLCASSAMPVLLYFVGHISDMVFPDVRSKTDGEDCLTILALTLIVDVGLCCWRALKLLTAGCHPEMPHQARRAAPRALIGLAPRHAFEWTLQGLDGYGELFLWCRSWVCG